MTEAVNTNLASDKIFTIPNVISFIRLLMAPLFFVLFTLEHNLIATVLFVLAASTDFVDGKIARATNSVSKVGQILDPAVDRVLMIAAVICLFIAGRLPLWIILLVLARDCYLIWGSYYILTKYKVRISVIYLGKVVTTLLFIGCAGMMLNGPLVDGLGLCDISWLPGFNHEPCSWGIWVLYAGLLLGLFTTSYYIVRAVRETNKVKALRKEEGQSASLVQTSSENEVICVEGERDNGELQRSS